MPTKRNADEFARIGRAELFIKLQSEPDEKFRSMGNIRTANLSLQANTVGLADGIGESNTNVAEAVTNTEGSMTAQLDEWTAENLALFLQGTVGQVTQASASGETLDVTSAEVGHQIKLPAMDVSNVSVEDTDATETFAAGDITVDEEAGIVQIDSWPSGGTEGNAITVTYDQAEIVAGDGLQSVDAGTRVNETYTVLMRENQTQGRRRLARVHRWKPSPNGEAPLIQQDQFGTLNVSGAILEDADRANFKFWELKDLPGQ